MSDRERSDDQTGSVLRDWMHDAAPSTAPNRLAASVREAARTTRQDRYVLGWPAIAAAAVVIVAVVISVAVYRPEPPGFGTPDSTQRVESGPPVSQPQSTSVEPTAAPTQVAPDGSPDPAIEAWPRAGVEVPAAISSRMEAVARGEGGFVAVGGSGSIEGLGGALAWYSSDGQQWDLTLDRIAMRDGSRLFDVTAFDGRFVAVGQNPSGSAVWVSTDGRSWSPVADPSVPTGPVHDLVAVAVRDAGLFAIGSSTDGDAQVATAWTSPDGVVWTRLAVSDTFAEARPVGISTKDDGAGVILGRRTAGANDLLAWPLDGQTIGEPVELQKTSVEVVVGSIVATPGGFTIVGDAWDSAAAAYRLVTWTSDDATTWDLEESGIVGLASGAAYVEGRGIVVVGQTYRLESSEVGVWERPEPGRWISRLIEDSNGGGTGVTTDASGRLIVVGSDDPDGAATVWLEP